MLPLPGEYFLLKSVFKLFPLIEVLYLSSIRDGSSSKVRGGAIMLWVGCYDFLAPEVEVLSHINCPAWDLYNYNFSFHSQSKICLVNPQSLPSIPIGYL